jgi:hypothetical protein
MPGYRKPLEKAVGFRLKVAGYILAVGSTGIILFIQVTTKYQ